jgi:hypothetical protein
MYERQLTPEMASNSTPLCCPLTLRAKKPFSVPFLLPVHRAQHRLVLSLCSVPRLVQSGQMGLDCTTKRLPHQELTSRSLPLSPTTNFSSQTCTTKSPKDLTVSSTSRNPVTDGHLHSLAQIMFGQIGILIRESSRTRHWAVLTGNNYEKHA